MTAWLKVLVGYSVQLKITCTKNEKKIYKYIFICLFGKHRKIYNLQLRNIKSNELNNIYIYIYIVKAFFAIVRNVRTMKLLKNVLHPQSHNMSFESQLWYLKFKFNHISQFFYNYRIYVDVYNMYS